MDLRGVGHRPDAAPTLRSAAQCLLRQGPTAVLSIPRLRRHRFDAMPPFAGDPQATTLVPTAIPAVDTSGAIRSQLLAAAAATDGGLTTAARGLLAAVAARG